MTRLFDDPEEFAATALAGFCAANRDRVRPVPHGALRAAPGPRGKVALLVGGGLFLLLKSVAVLKLRYLDSQLMPSDFIYYVRSSLLDTLRHYPHLYTVGLALGALLPPLLYLVWRWDWRVLERPPPRRRAVLRAPSRPPDSPRAASR